MFEIDIDGKKLQVKEGMTIIEAADEAGIHIPRFCYHKQLSIAANCRMCLVEVEKVGKPLPACATPVAADMKVYTQSAKARAAQKGVMEYLLINHPLDCPICDQGGECELQDTSVGYGAPVSNYEQTKRSVFNEDLGPLIDTEMTRCIHCTRCVRFGEEVAGMRELGATYRGEHMQIGTYVKHMMKSELSGNVIDLCPVGALTSKPFRYSARSWEMREHASIAAHDCVGSNIYVHSRMHEYSPKRKILRVVPRENESINKIWISDRDRFSYLGHYHPDRLLKPWSKQADKLNWKPALEQCVDKLQAFLHEHGPDELAVLVSPNATLEELFLLQKFTRALGCPHIDHRIRQQDFSDQDSMPAFPALGVKIAELSQLDSVLLVGSDVQREQAIIGAQLFQAAEQGASLMAINPIDYEFNFNLTHKAITADLVTSLASILAALYQESNQDKPTWLTIEVTELSLNIAKQLKVADKGWLLMGEFAINHPHSATVRALVYAIAELSGVAVGQATDGPNTAGAWLAGALPHRAAAGATVEQTGLTAVELLASKPKRAYLLWGVEPDSDCAYPAAALKNLAQAEWVVAFSPFITKTLKNYSDFVFPIALATETSGTFVNGMGDWQSFTAVTEAPGQAKSGWKIIKVLAQLLDMDGFSYDSTEAVRDELKAKVAAMANNSPEPMTLTQLPTSETALMRLAPWPMYRTDSLVRRADALQATQDDSLSTVSVCSELAAELELESGDAVIVRQGDSELRLTLTIDDRVAKGLALLPSGLDVTAGFGQAMNAIDIKAANRELL